LRLDKVIRCWRGVPKMKVGEKMRLICPRPSPTEPRSTSADSRAAPREIFEIECSSLEK